MVHSSRVLSSALRSACHVSSSHTCQPTLARDTVTKAQCHLAGRVRTCEIWERSLSLRTSRNFQTLHSSTPILSKKSQNFETQNKKIDNFSNFYPFSVPTPSVICHFSEKVTNFSKIYRCFPSTEKKIPSFFVRTMASGDEIKTENKEDFKNFEGAVVTPEWLAENLKKVKVLDASWHMPGDNRNAKEEFQAGRIAGAIFFDIDAISDPNSDLPHMLPSEAAFSVAASCLSLSNSDPIVVYDKKGIFSAARAWWMFRAFGHEKIWVLQGGFPKYDSLNLPVNSGNAEKELEKAAEAIEAVKTFQKAKLSEVPAGTYEAHLQHDLVWSLDQVLKTLESQSHQVVDARSPGRFKGLDPEPRKGVRGGHIPGSANVPFPKVLTPDGFVRDVTELKETFETAGLQLEKPIVASCGTGVTACVLALALFQLGKKNVPVYDGSWTEWGGREDTPVIKTTETSKIPV